VINVTKRSNFHQRLVILFDIASPEITESTLWKASQMTFYLALEDWRKTISETIFRPLRTALAADNDA
jgi:hypothetical protein